MVAPYSYLPKALAMGVERGHNSTRKELKTHGTTLIAYSNHLYGEHHKAFEVAIAEQEASFQPRECVFCDLSLRSKTAWVEHVSTPRHVANEQYAKNLLKLTCTTNVCTELEHPLRSKGKRSFEEACAEVVAEFKRIKSNPLVRFTSTSIDLTET
jgi:hypothetical protein